MTTPSNSLTPEQLANARAEASTAWNTYCRQFHVPSLAARAVLRSMDDVEDALILSTGSPVGAAAVRAICAEMRRLAQAALPDNRNAPPDK
jgi:hypothetical protein